MSTTSATTEGLNLTTTEAKLLIAVIQNHKGIITVRALKSSATFI